MTPAWAKMVCRGCIGQYQWIEIKNKARLYARIIIMSTVCPLHYLPVYCKDGYMLVGNIEGVASGASVRGVKEFHNLVILVLDMIYYWLSLLTVSELRMGSRLRCELAFYVLLSISYISVDINKYYLVTEIHNIDPRQPPSPHQWNRPTSSDQIQGRIRAEVGGGKKGISCPLHISIY